MKPPCELIVNKIIPAIRAASVRVLINEYGMKQTEVSKTLGITQSAVSQYITHARGGHEDISTLFPEIEEFARKIAAKVVTGELSGQDIDLCEPCRQIREKEEFCISHKNFSRLPPTCHVCEHIH